MASRSNGHRSDVRVPPPSPRAHPADLPDDAEEILDPDAIEEPVDHEGGPGAAEEARGLTRAAVGVIGHTGGWAAGAYLRAGRRAIGVLITPASGVELARDLAVETAKAVSSLSEATGLERRLDAAGPAGALIKGAGRFAGSLVPARAADLARTQTGSASLERRRNANGRPPNLRRQGEELLRRSRDVNDAYDAHPAYARILSELAPDEARILQLMLIDGPQPTVDVRTGGPLGLINSRLIAPGLSMIGARAGCRYVDRVPSYLNNLFRLGLIWFSRETLRDHLPYQVLEAQPDVLAAIHSVGAAKVVRRSVHLTPFGEDFCRVAFPESMGDLATLPEHSAPRESASAAQPPSEPIAD